MKYADYKPFLRWWLFFSLIIVGLIFLFHWNMFDIVNQGDVTKISFLIFGLFIIFSFFVGNETYRGCKYKIISESHLETGWFMSDQILTLGMIGTVIGFIYMLSTSFTNIAVNDLSKMAEAIISMGTGMSTALYTTASGLICSFLLKLQLYNLSVIINESKEVL